VAGQRHRLTQSESAEHCRRERQQRHEREERQIEGEQRAIDVGQLVKRAVMPEPEDAGERERDEVAEEDRPQLPEAVPDVGSRRIARELRHLQLQHEQRHDDREDAIAEGSNARRAPQYAVDRSLHDAPKGCFTADRSDSMATPP
jgi:hypothetical protein